MAYSLLYDEKTVAPYLRALDLSREGRIILAASLHRELRLNADVFINNPERRLFPGSDCFRFDLLFRDPIRRDLHHLQLVISDASARYGILRLVFVEVTSEKTGS